MKLKKCLKAGRSIFLVIVLGGIGVLNSYNQTNAKVMSEVMEGRLLVFEEGSDYEIAESVQEKSITSGSAYGEFTVTGNIKAIPEVNGVNAYEVLDGNVVMGYDFVDTYITDASDQWYLIDDKSDAVNGEKLDAAIGTGAVMVQTSLTGDTWVTDTVYTDIRTEKSEYDKDFYTSRAIQQVNGCYYRVLVAYEVEKKEEVDKSITNWLGVEKEGKTYAEMYTFYLVNSSEHSGDVTLATDTPRKELGTKINTGKDNGYSGNAGMSSEDPHYGWEIGTFFVNGYTRETTDDAGNPVFLKNVGNRVTLWFNLNEAIDSLNNQSNLLINEDVNGHDEYFEVPKTNFKKGTLIIRYTDHEGKVHAPIIYTDYLAANASTGANTKVELFEEGDYEVALDYEIVDSKGIDSYTNYRLAFEFAIRNGNCMVYPFDTLTGAELTDKSITENGFRLDMARSRYLTIDVLKEVVKLSEGGYITDERFNGPAKDGETYLDEGIYTFTVKNLYTDSEPMTKVIYVGTSPQIRAVAKGNTLDEINVLIAEGAVLEEDGTLTLPMQEEKVLETTIEGGVASKENKGSEEVTFLNIAKELTEQSEEENQDIEEAMATQREGEEGSVYLIVLSVVGLGMTIGVVLVILKSIKRHIHVTDNSKEVSHQENLLEEVVNPEDHSKEVTHQENVSEEVDGE